MLFHSIGKTYNDTRAADDRIVSELIRLLSIESGATLADIGAGTGNYSIALANAGFNVKAIEPSSRMLSHSGQNPNIEWIIGCAEDIPLQTDRVDGVFSVLALPHFSDIDRAFKEMGRISKTGPIVIFTFDPGIGRTTWLYEYFPFCWDRFSHLPSIEETAESLRNCTHRSTQMIPFKLPADLKDHFAAASWKQPDRYLDRDYRSNISSFRMTDTATVDDRVACLAVDLKSGQWNELYGDILQMDRMDAGYYFLWAGR